MLRFAIAVPVLVVGDALRITANITHAIGFAVAGTNWRTS